MNLLTPADGDIRLAPSRLHNRTDSGADARFAFGHPTPPRRPNIVVSDYRVFTTVIFACIVALDAWSDLKWSPLVSTYVVGPSSVLVWALTLAGSFGVGPVYRTWHALYVRPRSRRLRAAAFTEHQR